MSEERLLTPGEAANRLRVPLSWIYSKTRTKEIPLLKLGKYIRIPEKELDAWARAQQK